MGTSNGRRACWIFGLGVAGLALLARTGTVPAQVRTGGATGSASSMGGASFGGGISGSSFGGGIAGSSFSGGFSGSSFGGGFSGGSFSGGFSGSSFSGGMSGSSFSGGSFSGGSTFSGGGVSGNVSRPGGGVTGFGNNTYQGVSPTNPFVQTYADPLALGMSTTNGRATFGVPLFNLSTTTGNLTGGSALGITGGTGTAAFTPTPATNMTTPFVAAIGVPTSNPVPPPGPVAVSSQLRTEVQQVISRSSALPSRNNIQVAVVGPAVVLRGTVGDEQERQMAEGLVRLRPGVHEVVNELRVRTAPATARTLPPP